MYPHFFQNWSLFAPDPISEDRGIISKLRCEDGRETESQDLTTDLIKGVQSRRFFGSREMRVISNAIVIRFREDDYSKRLLSDKNSKISDQARKILEEERKDAEGEADKMLASFSATKRSGLCGDAKVSAVQIRYVVNKFPGWSSKEKPTSEGEVSYIDSEWINIP